RRLEELGRKRQGAAVVGAGHQRIADRAGLIALGQQVAQRRKVFEPLRHLLAHRVLQVLGVQPVADELLAGRRLALGNLVLVMRKDVVDATGVDVEALPQVLHAHRRALDVPARTPGAQRRLPGLFARLAGLPEDEITRVILPVVVNVDPSARPQPTDVEVRQPTVAWKRRDPEVGRAIANVGVALLVEDLDQPHHLEDVSGGSRVLLRPLDAEGIEVLKERLDVFLGELVDGDSGIRRFLDDAVLDIGQIHHLRHLVTLLSQHAPKQILEEERSKIPDVSKIVHRRAAGVHPNVTRLERSKLFDLAAHGVVQAQRCHGASFRSTTAWAANASPRPMAPTWSVVVALSPTAAGSTPNASARLLRISSRYGASFGTCANRVTSAFSTSHRARRQWSVTSRNRSRLRASL